MTLSLGEQLRKLREERDLTLQQVAMGTHIRLQYIQALESDERELLPSTVQGKGFVRVIAGFLNVPVEPLLDLWEGKIPARAPVLPDETNLEKTQSESEPAIEEYAEEQEEPEAAMTATPDEDSEPTVEFEPAPESEIEQTQTEEQAPSESVEIFESIGAKLRYQRETISLTLDDVERFTKVRKHYLQALEGGRIDELPSPVQGRGMLSNYAAFLNLDTETLLLQFAEALQIRRLERPTVSGERDISPTSSKKNPAPTTASPAKIAWRRLITPDLLVGGVLFLSMLGFVIWGAARVSRLTAEASVVTPPSISEILQITATASPTPEAQGATPAVTQAAELPEGEAATTASESEETTNLEETAALGNGTPAGPQAGALQIHVIANQRAFLRIVADGETAFNGRVTPGSAYTFSAEEQLELLTGNAAALQVFYQQQDLGSLGLMGQVASLVFTTEGIITPTVQPTPTGQPTHTPTPTIAATSDGPAPTITPYIP